MTTDVPASNNRDPLVVAPGDGRSYPAIADWFLRRAPGDADC